MTTTTTCDECGKTAESQAGNFAWNAPNGWLTITGIGPVISADMPLEHRRKQPDLCSLRCVATWAGRLAARDEDRRSVAAQPAS